MPIVRSFQISHGSVAAERTPDTPEDLYATPTELSALFGCDGVDEGDIRFAMSLIHAHCNRPTLWPVEHETGILQIAADRQQTRVPITPVIRLLDVSGRFAMGRRDRQSVNQQYFGYTAALSLLSSPPRWTTINPDACEFEPATGVVWLATSQFLTPFNQIKLSYIGGYIEIPFRVKSCLALLINEVHAKGVSDRTKYTAGRVTRQYASTSFISPQAAQFLAPFVIQDLA